MKNLYSGTHHGGFQFLLILDLWGISFHAAVVFGLGKDFLFESALRHCESLHDTKTVNYHYRPSFSDLTKDLINFLPHIQNQEHQLITEQHNESYGSEQDIVYGEIELVKKKAKCIIQFLLSNLLRNYLNFRDQIANLSRNTIMKRVIRNPFYMEKINW